MRVYRFFLRNKTSPAFIGEPQEIFHFKKEDEPEIFFQLQKVLRAKKDDRLIIAAQQASAPFFDYHFIVQSAHEKEFVLSFELKKENDNELSFNLELILSLPNKPDKLAFILQKATELGVHKISLVHADFSDFKHPLKLERFNKIVLEAGEQSERGRVPEVFLGGKLKDFLGQYHAKEKAVLTVGMEHLSVKKSAVADNKQDNFFNTIDKKNGLSILIGPEGGFSPAEKRQITDLHLPCFSLGKRVLRMETAAILSLGLAGLSS